MTRRTPGSGVHREQFRSRKLSEIEAFLQSHYAGIAVRAAGRGLELGNDAVVADGFAFNHMWTTLSMQSRMGPTCDVFAVGHVRSGGVVWNSDAFGPVHGGPGSAAVAAPIGEVEHSCEQVDLDIVTLDTDRVAQYVEHVCGVDPESFRILGLTPVSPTRNQHWNRVVEHVRDDMLGNPVLADNPIVLDNAFRALATAFLTTFPSTALAELSGPAVRVTRRRVPERTLREVTDYLHAHADEPVGPADIASAAGLPMHDVVGELRRWHETHPSELLWAARLRGVRADLAEADPDGSATVSGLAARWGFTNPGRFRIAYARAFGEIPESTLHRS